MKYKVTALTPLLVGDGRELSPIDYMVWKDQVNVLDQNAHFQTAFARPSPGWLSDPAAQGNQTRFRILGRLRAKLLAAPHSL